MAKKNVTLTMNVREARRLALMLRLHSADADVKAGECLTVAMNLEGEQRGIGNKAYRSWRRAARKAWALAGDLELKARDVENAQFGRN